MNLGSKGVQVLCRYRGLRMEIRARLGEIVFLVMNDAGDLIRGVAETSVQGEIVFLFSKRAKIVFLTP